MRATGDPPPGKSTRGTTRLAWLVLVGAALAACLAPSEPRENQTLVSESWIWNRKSPGHTIHLEADLTCDDCHQLGHDESVELDSPAVCERCHADQPLHHGTAPGAVGNYENCVGCHGFARDDAPADLQPLGLGGGSGFNPPDDCLSCHEAEQGSHPAVAVHADQPCLNCHQPHGDSALGATDCKSCHTEVHLEHGKRSTDGRPTHEQCLDCHRPHAEAKVAGDACPTCHVERRTDAATAPRIPATATFEGGHERCNGCHQSHDLRDSASRSCQTCHEGHGALSSGRVAAHRDCTSCHNPHDVKQGAHDACAGCHKAQHTDHPATRGALGPCVTCHAPHPDAAGQARARPAACTSCHGEPHEKKGHGGAGLACTQCHTPHAFAGAVQQASLCSNCHAGPVSGVSKNPGHATCGNCHSGLPHHPQDASSDCARCHQDHSAATRKHSACVTCHEPHGGTQGKACSSCHSAEHRSAPAGHQNCSSCHDAHRADPKQPTQACSSCHAAQTAKNPHMKFAEGCQTCHRPHGGSGKKAPAGPATPPDCSSCHRPATLTGLHTESGHRTCTSCHSPHDSAPRRDRANCTSCHKAQKDHQPGAENCASCHLFRGATR